MGLELLPKCQEQLEERIAKDQSHDLYRYGAWSFLAVSQREMKGVLPKAKRMETTVVGRIMLIVKLTNCRNRNLAAGRDVPRPVIGAKRDESLGYFRASLRDRRGAKRRQAP